MRIDSFKGDSFPIKILHTCADGGKKRRTPLVLHCGLRQRMGSVYPNCCSTRGTRLRHLRHLKAPASSSGRTSVVRVTVPLTCATHFQKVSTWESERSEGNRGMVASM